MADHGLQTSEDWIETFLKFIKYLRIDSKEIQAADDKGSPLDLWPSQMLFLKELANGLSKGIRIFYVLKSRQLGISTVSLAIDIFWLALHPGTIGCFVVDTESNRETFRSVIRRYIKSFPKNFFGKDFQIVKGGDNRNMMRFSNGSRLDFLVAGTRKNTTWAESKGYVVSHLCVAKGTPVVVEHGRIKPIEEINVGDKVLTHTGSKATVVDVLGQPNTKGDMIQISPWLGQPIICTKDHKISTKRGLVKAGELKKEDLLVMPVRKITGGGKKISLVSARNIRGNNQGPRGAGSGKEILLGEEFGFAIGYYLAEGHMCVNTYDGRPCALIFTRHRDEKHYADRAINAISAFTTGNRKTTDRKNSLTSIEHVYGTPLAQWIDSMFGRLDEKKIPDEVFGWGKDFCRGLLSGLLSGDGSKKISYATNKKKTIRYPLNYVNLSTTRSSLAMQVRDIATALGYGWAGIDYVPAGERYKRNCKAHWTVRWSGANAGKLRKLMGLEEIPTKGHVFSHKYIVTEDTIFIKIKNIKNGFKEPEMWDISVDHEDHTFRTPYMSISNSEVSKYGDSRGLDSFKESMSTSHPNRLYVYESTANGFNHWRDMWFEAGRDKNFIQRIFVGWWSNPLNSISKTDQRFSIYGAQPPDEDEQAQIDWVKNHCGLKVKMEQLAWYRWRCSDTSVDMDSIHQLQPWNDEECFVKSGNSFFPMRVISDKIKDLSDNLPQFHGFKYWLGNDFYAGKMEEIVDMDRLDEVDLKIWERPKEGHYYAIGMDCALGRTDWGDQNTIEVFDCFADKMVQVAEYGSSNEDTRQAAWVLAYLAGIYSNCRINIDVTGGYGVAIMNELDQLKQRMRSEMYSKITGGYEWDDFLSNASYYLYHRPDSMGAGYAKNWVWTSKTKFWAGNSYRDSFGANLLEIKSIALLNQMSMVVRDGMDLGGAQGKLKDDLVFAAILAEVAWKEWLRPMMINDNYTYERVSASENGDARHMHDKVVMSIVDKFFKEKEEASKEFDPRPQWMVDRGLA